MEKELAEIQIAVNRLLNIKSLVRKKKKRPIEKKQELFVSIIRSIEKLTNRQQLMYAELQLDFSKYDESFLEIIDALILLQFGKEGAELIGWYIWDRLNPDGTINQLVDVEGNKFAIETPQQLWSVLVAINPNIDNEQTVREA